MRDNLTRLLSPHSVAVIGASADASRIGGRTVRMLIETGFAGPIYPVNPNRAEIQGLKAYPSIADVPGPVDCAIVGIPAASVLAALRECAAAGVGAAIIFSGGFAEAEEVGQALQAEITALCRETGLRVLGPNCTGLYNMPELAYLTFFEAGTATPDTGRNVAIVSQSGGYGAHIIKLANDRGLRVSHLVTTGNEADVEVGEVLLRYAADPAINVLVAYVEGIRTPGPFIAALDLARRNRKPVVLMKCGYTARGALAAASHTASMAGADLAYDLLFLKYGVHRARSTEEVLDVASAACMPHWPRDNTVAVLTNSGGMGVQIADFVEESDLTLATIDAATQKAILGFTPNGSAANPIDTTAQWLNDKTLIANCTEALLAGAAPSVLVVFMGTSISHPTLRETLGAITKAHPQQPIVLVMPDHGDDARAYQAIGCLCIEEPARAIRALAALHRFRIAFDRGEPEAIAPGAMRLQAGDLFDEHAAKQLLAQAGIANTSDAVAATPALAASHASAIGFPVALKILSRDIPHKTEVGGVVLNLTNPTAVNDEAAEMLERVAQACPKARIEGLLVSPMLTGGVECIVGLQVDKLFGPMVMVGLGGVMTELVKDIAWRLAPVSETEAEEMVDSLRLAPVLRGHRGKTPADVPALARAIAALSRLGAGNADVLETVEVNPLLVRDAGQGAVMLDALVRTVAA